MKKNYFFSFLLTIAFTLTTLSQVTINEFEPNPTGSDPAEDEVELKGTPNTSFDLWILSIESDSGNPGVVDRVNNVTGTFDANGIAIATIEDLENPSFTLVLCDNFTGEIGDDLDTNGDGTVDVDLTVLGNVLDAIGIPDNTGDEANLYGAQLGGADFKFTGSEPVLVFRDGTTDAWYALNNLESTEVLSIAAEPLPVANFNTSPASFTFGSTNPIYTEPVGPSLVFDEPADEALLSPVTSEVPVELIITNFTLSGDDGNGDTDSQGDGYVKATLEVTGESPTVSKFFTTTPPNIEVQVGKTYTLTAELVDNSGNSLDPKVESIVSFSVATYTDVISISDLRNGTEGNYYRLDGDNVTLTYARSSRNQKYIQDQTGGILIDDSAGVISTEYSTYAVMPILTGRLGSFGGVLQLIPDQDPGASQFNNDGFQPVQVSLADYVANFENYESELITINDISFDSGDVGNNFASSTNYDITSGQTSSVFRTNFFEADYIDTAIPDGSYNITAFGGEFNGTPQITAINLAGIVLGVQQNQIEGFTTFPNPVTNGELTITSGSTTSKVVSIYNVLGKQVLTDVFLGTFKTVNLANFSSGIYILKVAEGNKIATKKLVIK
jgi:hypothetical protein